MEHKQHKKNIGRFKKLLERIRKNKKKQISRARRADHILKDVISGRHDRYDNLLIVISQSKQFVGNVWFYGANFLRIMQERKKNFSDAVSEFDDSNSRSNTRLCCD